MPPITKANIAVDGHRAYGYLSTIDEAIVLSRAVNMATITYPVTEITFDNPYSGIGSTADVRDGMEVIVYSQNTSTVKGRLRVAPGAASATVLQVNEFSEGVLALSDNDRFEVVYSFRIRQRLVADNADFDRDSRVAYTDQNKLIPPICNSGGAYANFVSFAGSVGWLGSTSVAIDPDSAGTLTHAWTFPSATPASSTSANPTVDYSNVAAGTYMVTHTVTDTSNSRTATQYVPVRLHDADDPPYDCAASLIGSRETGWRGSFTVYGSAGASIADLPDGALVIFWLEEYYGGTRISYGSQVDTRSHIKFVGYLAADTVEWDYQQQVLTFEAISPIEILGLTGGLSQVIENNANPTTWLQFDQPTVNLAIWYLLYWSSTILLSHDLILPLLTYTYPAFYVQELDLLSQLNELADAQDCQITSDRNGRIHVNPPPPLQTATDKALYGVTLTFETSDIKRIVIPRQHRLRYALVEGRGFSAGFTNNAPFLSRAPGDAPSDAVGKIAFERKIINPNNPQSDLNERTGRAYARLNGTVNGLTVPQDIELSPVTGGYDVFDPAYAERILLTLTDANKRGILYSAFETWLTEINVDYTASGSQQITMTVSGVPDGEPGVTYILPIVSNPDPPIDFVNPPPQFPPGGNPGILQSGTGKIALFLSDNTLRRTTNFSAGSPTWSSLDLTGLANWGGGTLVDFTVDAYSPLYRGTGSTVNGWIMTTSHVQRITDIFGSPALTTAHALPFTVESGCMNFERGVQNWGICAQHRNAASGGTSIAYTTDGLTWTNVNINANYENNSAINGNTWIPGLYISPHIAGRAYVTTMLGVNTPQGSGFQGYVTTDYGATWNLLSSTTCNITDGMFNAGMIVVPYQNAAMTTAFFGGREQPGSFVTMQLLRAIGSSKTDISPIVSSEAYGVDFLTGNRQAAVADSDQNTVVLCGTHRNSSTGVRKYAVFLSRNQGTTWSILIAPTTTAADQPYRQVYIAGDNPNVLYLVGINGEIAFVPDGVTIWNKRGNLSTSGTIKGLCGG